MSKLPLKKELYIKKKRRLMAKLMKGGEIKDGSSWVSVHGSSKELLATYESSGLIVSINGGGSLKEDHPVCQQAEVLSEYIIDKKGIIINGGRYAGVMKASYKIAKDRCLGVIFPELKKETPKEAKLVMVDSPQPRIELLATCTPVIVVFRGGLGTLSVLLRAIRHTKNRIYHPEQPPQLVFVSNYWIGLLQILLNLGCLPREFLTELNFFNQAEDIINLLNKINK